MSLLLLLLVLLVLTAFRDSELGVMSTQRQPYTIAVIEL